MHQLASPHLPQPAETRFPFADEALVATQEALDARRIAWWSRWEAELRPAGGMRRRHPILRYGEALTQATGTATQHRGNWTVC